MSTASRPERSPLHRFVDVHPGETAPMVVSALYFFFTLSSFFILRPIRDEMAVASGVRTLPWLFAGTLGVMLLANPLYSALVGRFTMKRFVVITYGFFALNLLVFYLAWRAGWDPVSTGRAFFIWTSVYNLFVVSVFWGVMADTFHSSQAKRLFGFIAVGGTLGSITGSAITAFFVETVGVANLLLVSTAFVLIATILVSKMPAPPVVADSIAPQRDRDKEIVGGSMWAGIVHTLSSPYLAGIGGFLLLYTLGSTVLYYAQTDIIGQFYEDRERRTAVLAQMELIVQTLTAVGQALLTARIIRTAGLPFTLAAVPFVSIVGFAALAFAVGGALPLLTTFMILYVARRATEFILTNPSRKILFTVVSREDKYKASNFLETFVYRGGDQLAGWGYATLIAVGLTLAGISWITVVFSAAYLALAIWLGRRQQEMARETAATDRAARPLAASEV
jgi:AAA family ATP:ADP antiporter